MVSSGFERGERGRLGGKWKFRARMECSFCDCSCDSYDTKTQGVSGCC